MAAIAEVTWIEHDRQSRPMKPNRDMGMVTASRPVLDQGRCIMASAIEIVPKPHTAPQPRGDDITIHPRDFGQVDPKWPA